MQPHHYYNTQKYCSHCRDYVRFLQSLDQSYCVDCGAKVRLFSPNDKKTFLAGIKASKRPGRPKKRVS